MKLITPCQGCKKNIRIKAIGVSTRPDLEMEKGERFKVNCKNCGKYYSIHVNDVRAKESKFMLLFAIGISLLVTMILWNFFGAISTATMIIPMLIYRQESVAVNLFNSYLSKRRRT